MLKHPLFYQLLVRDSVILMAVAALWVYVAPYSAGDDALSDFAGVVVGGAACLCAHLLHEWGHLSGGLIGRSVMTPGRNIKSLSLFNYSSSENTKKQFMLMSFAGFFVTGMLVYLCFFTPMLEANLASRILRGYLLFQVFLGITLEMPLVLWALVGKGLPPIDKSVSQVLKGG